MRMLTFLTMCLLCQAVCAQSAVELRERWEVPYTGKDATGPHVLGLWTFDHEQAERDSSAQGRHGTLQGAEVDSQGRFGASLRTFRGWPVEDERHRLLIQHHPSLTPTGPFTLELWINADETLADYPQAFLADKKYVADHDYQLILQGPDRSGARRLQANLGFGNRSESWHSDPLEVVPGKWYHLAFSYDAEGTGRFFVNGQLWGVERIDGVKQIAGGTHPLSIGDRVGSYYHGFPGRIDQVRLTAGARDFRLARLERISDRTCFRRMEQDVELRFRLLNLDHQDLTDACCIWTLDGRPSAPIDIQRLEPGGSHELSYGLDTGLRPDTYRLEARLERGPTGERLAQDRFAVQIVPRPIPGRFPVVMWGAGPAEVARLKQIGFTHALGIGADYGRIWEAGEAVAPADTERVRATRRSLDEALAENLSFAASLSPGRYLRRKEALRRVDRSGKPLSREAVCASFPELAEFCFHVGKSVAQAYGDLPAFQAALLHTEVRDSAQPCFHAHDRAAYRAATGAEIPAEVKTKWGVSYEQLDDFPANRVIPDDHPLYRYYRWYWKAGDGWNQLNSALQRGLWTMERADFWTWHDPAVRVASVFGSGGDVDVISQWTYSYPDPIRIGVATDELLAMARGAAAQQQVMKMTQIIWYRSQTAPQAKESDEPRTFEARWEREQPEAPFITIAPMHLREAFWAKIARPIQGIMYHGWQSLVPVASPSGYRHTHPEAQHELQRLVRNVVQPLGPALRRIPGVQSDVAYYESFAAQVFAGRGTYGWGGKWLGDAHQVAQWADLQMDVVFDETIQQRGLAGYRILFMLDCDVIVDSVARRIIEFQRRGGLVVGDANTAPAIKPDIVLPIYKRTGHAAEDKAALLKIAAQLRDALATRYRHYVSTDNPEVIPYRRRYADTDYLFLINDHRQYGRYVGHHGRVMENGLPSRALVTIRRDEAAIYDLVRHASVASESVTGTRQVELSLGPGEGRLLMVTPVPIADLQLAAPRQVQVGEQARLQLSVVAAGGQPLRAVVPVELTIEDADARRAEYSGYWAAVNGKLEVVLDIARNDPPGAWTIRARELASGKTRTVFMRVRGETARTPSSRLDEEAANPVQPDG